jgi:hypothetical protein
MILELIDVRIEVAVGSHVSIETVDNFVCMLVV